MLFRHMHLYATILILLIVAPPALAGDITVETTPVPLNPDRPSQTAAGALAWRGGLALNAEHARFGGLSGLEALDNGDLVAVSDLGWRFDFRPRFDSAGNLAGIDALGYAPLTGLDGRRLSGKRDTDAKSLARLADGGLLVAFERRHRLAPLTGAAVGKALAPPEDLSRAPSNGGIEAMTALADGRLLILSEKMLAGANERGAVAGWIGRPGDWRRIAYPVSLGYLPTGAATLADGSLLVLERHYTPLTGVAARLRHLSPASLASGTVSGPLVAALKPPASVDNMEGIAAVVRGGRTFVYLLSDDNLNPAEQRTLLTMFEWRE